MGAIVGASTDASNRSIEDPDVIPDASDRSDPEAPGTGSARLGVPGDSQNRSPSVDLTDQQTTLF